MWIDPDRRVDAGFIRTWLIAALAILAFIGTLTALLVHHEDRDRNEACERICVARGSTLADVNVYGCLCADGSLAPEDGPVVVLPSRCPPRLGR